MPKVKPAPYASMEYPDSVPPLMPPVRVPRLSVVIPAYDDLKGVLMCINSLRAMQVTDVEWLVQDDASPNVNLMACIPFGYASVERNEQNVGFAANSNRGAARATGDVLLFCNQDIQAAYGWSDGWDAALLSAFADPTVGAVGARLLFPNGGVQSVGGVFDALCQPVHRALGWANVHAPEIATPQEIAWSTGAALAVRRDVWQAVGGFDSVYGRGYFEDVELCLRVRELGFKVWYEPRCTLIHAPGSTGGNPRFVDNARTFRDRWVTSGKVKAGTLVPTFRYW
jgi:O-antigen biosynthesis protein